MNQEWSEIGSLGEAHIVLIMNTLSKYLGSDLLSLGNLGLLLPFIQIQDSRDCYVEIRLSMEK